MSLEENDDVVGWELIQEFRKGYWTSSLLQSHTGPFGYRDPLWNQNFKGDDSSCGLLMMLLRLLNVSAREFPLWRAGPLPWEFPYATGGAVKKKKKKWVLESHIIWDYLHCQIKSCIMQDPQSQVCGQRNALHFQAFDPLTAGYRKRLLIFQGKSTCVWYWHLIL